MRIEKLNEGSKQNLLEALLKRSPNSYGMYEASVQEIIRAVKDKKDEALFSYTERFDGFSLNKNNILVTKEEIDQAYQKVDGQLLEIIRRAMKNIREYHAVQLVSQQTGWHYTRSEGNGDPKSRRLCSGGKGSLSFFSVNEHSSSKGSWGRKNYHGNAAG